MLLDRTFLHQKYSNKSHNELQKCLNYYRNAIASQQSQLNHCRELESFENWEETEKYCLLKIKNYFLCIEVIKELLPLEVPWRSLPKYKLGEFLHLKQNKAPWWCLGIIWRGTGWYYVFDDVEHHEQRVFSLGVKLDNSFKPINYAIGSTVSIPFLRVPKALIIGIRQRQEIWGMDWAMTVSWNCGDRIATFSQHDLQKPC